MFCVGCGATLGEGTSSDVSNRCYWCVYKERYYGDLAERATEEEGE